MKILNAITHENETEEAFRDGQFLGIITGGVIFALAFLVLSAMPEKNNVPCADGYTRTKTTCIRN